MYKLLRCQLLAGLLLAPVATRAEIVEEIVAWVNGEIITKTDYEEELKAAMAEAYRQHSGTELDQAVERIRSQLLLQMIDRKVLVHHARALGYDLARLGEMFLDSFQEQQKIATREELVRQLAKEGMTIEDVKQRLLEFYAPERVIEVEVTSRVSVSEGEIEAYYEKHPDEFYIEGEVTMREIVLLADDPEAKANRRPEAEEIHRRAMAGEDFAELARTRSEAGTRDEGGLIGPLKRRDLAEILAETAFRLPIGTVSEMMETPYGFHLVRVESRVDSHVPPLREVRDRVRQFLEESKRRERLASFMKEARSRSEWCVKPKHAHLLSGEVSPPCDSF
jgi:parvulin-like peptidyl-prolyl isomerase